MSGAGLVCMEVWSDVQCIWCYIFNARLCRAIELFDGRVEVTYRSFQLSPNAPVEIDRAKHILSHGVDPT